MASVDDYKGILPYAAELFGIYQPLLGWKSRIIQQRYSRLRSALYAELANRVLPGAPTPVSIRMRDADRRARRLGEFPFEVADLAPLDLTRALQPRVAASIDSGVSRMTSKELAPEPPQDWQRVINRDAVDGRLKKFQAILSTPGELPKYPELRDYVESFGASAGAQADPETVLRELFAKEAKVAGYLLFLAQNAAASLTPLFYAPTSALLSIARETDPLLSFGTNNYDAILSPIGIVHLYREYFFEFDSFLGPPVGHVWLSPGGTVELVEVSTRRTLTEKTLEQALETIAKSETQVTIQDDIAEAVKEENRNNTKLGFSYTGSYSSPVSSDTVTSTFSLDSNKSVSRETTHRQMRQQSEKLSSEIKRNFRTTFKALSEVTDTSSKRYVIQNTTDKLINYELRRKMRKVGVQVQDVGVALCWHTFVDDPGREIGVAKLVHIGEPPELGDLVQPEAPQMPMAQAQEVNIVIPFVGKDGNDDTDNDYTDGADYDWGNEYIEPDFEQRVMFTTPGFTLTNVHLDAQGFDAKLSARGMASTDGSSVGTFTVHLDYVNWHGKDNFPVTATLYWEPGSGTRTTIKEEYDKRVAQYSVEKARRYKEAFVKAARERIKLASEITPRPAEELREEERTVVYRTLISQLMSVGAHQSKHVISELVRSIFDVDKMLYFVAPEWWTPRLHRTTQDLGEEPGTGQPPHPGLPDVRTSSTLTTLARRLPGIVVAPDLARRGNAITSDNIVHWGGAKELGRDNYYITEDSQPAKLGSSLGWLLQLDGDNPRNAFLNAPWVKAVIPIRIGKEQAAINWLRQAHVEGSDGLDADYVAAPDDPPQLHSTPGQTVSIGDALDFLIERVHEFDQKSRHPIAANPADPGDPRNHFAGSLPTEAVFEHGFYPLKGGVQFGQDGTEQPIFSQWMEILPTDQAAALAVEYDPKTLQVREPPEEPPA